MNQKESAVKQEQQTSTAEEQKENHGFKEEHNASSTAYWRRNPLIYLRQFANEAERLFKEVTGKPKWFNKVSKH